MKDGKAASVIQIRPVSGHMMQEPKEYAEKVGDFLVTCFKGTSDGQARAVRRSLLDTTALSANSAGFTFPAASLATAMQYAAKPRHVQIRTIMPAVLDLPMPVRSSFSQNPVIGDFVHAFAAGIIEYGGNLTKAQVIAEVCLAYPGIPVLVLSSHRHELRRVFEQLPIHAPLVGVDDVSRGELPIDVVDVETAEDSNDIKSFQLALSTPTNAAMLWDTTGTDVRHYPIVICLDAARAKDLMTSGFLMASRSQFRIFGLKHSGSPFQGEAADLAHNVFGPVSLKLPESGFEQSETSYSWIINHCKLRNLPLRAKPVDALRLIPHCTERNNLVADVARSLADGGRFQDDELCQHWLQTNQIERPTVAIIARTLTQVARLLKRLPGWHVYRPDAAAELLVGLKTPDRKVILDRSVGELGNNRLICPLDYLAPFLQHVDPQIVVQASGGLQAPKFPPTWFRHSAGTKRQRLVIDVIDDALPITRRISERRFADYEPPDFLPVEIKASRQDLSISLPLMSFINRTFEPASKRRR